MNNNNLVGFDEIAEENFFCSFQAEETVGVLLNKVRANLEKSVTTIDQAVELVNNLTDEAADFNRCLTTVLNAYHEAEAGRMSKGDALEIAKPCIASLKEACVKLLGSDSDLATGDTDVNEVELRCLREFIIGCKTLAEERRGVLAGEEGARRPDGKAGTLVDNARGGILEAMNNIDYEDMIATEQNMNSLSKQAMLLLKGSDTKTADLLLKKAKAMHKTDPSRALSMVAQAERTYVKVLARAEKLAPTSKAKVSVGGGYAVGGMGIIGASGVSSTSTQKQYKTIGIAGAVSYLQDRIAACRALKMVWENKSNKGSYAEVKKQIKEELASKRREAKDARKAAKAEAKAAKRAAKAAPSAESYLYEDDYDDELAMESILADLDEATYGVDDSELDDIAVEAQVMTYLIDAGFEDEIEDL